MTVSSAGSVAYDALNLAKEAKRDIVAHEDICAIRYERINVTLSEMKSGIDEKFNMIWKIIAWAGGSAFLIVMGLLAFLAKTQFDSMTEFQRIMTQPQPVPQAAPPPQIIIQREAGQPPIGATVERQPNR